MQHTWEHEKYIQRFSQKTSSIDGKIMLKWTLEKQSVRVCGVG